MTAAVATTALSHDEKSDFLRFIRSMVHENKAASNTFTFRRELTLTDVQWINDIVNNIRGLFDTYMPTLDLSHVVEGENIIITCSARTPTNKVTNVLEDIDSMIGRIDMPSTSLPTHPTHFPSALLTSENVNGILQEHGRIMEEASDAIGHAIQRLQQQRNQPWWTRIFQ